MRSVEEKKKILQQYRTSVGEALRYADEIDRWRSIATRVTSGMSGAPGGSGGGMADAVAKFYDLENALSAQVKAVLELRGHLQVAIMALPDPDERAVLWLRYITGLPWMEIADKVNFSDPHTRRIHAAGLEHIDL